MQRIEITHVTRYRYAQAVRFLTHRLHLRPREGHDIRIECSALRIEPAHRIRWQRDVFGNSVALVDFEAESDRLEIISSVTVEQYEGPEADVTLDESLDRLPLVYDALERLTLEPYQQAVFPDATAAVDRWLDELGLSVGDIGALEFLDRLRSAVADGIGYLARDEPGVQSPDLTLTTGKGSCRDTATLFMEACRRRGLSSRFVSGYLVSGAAVEDLATTHAWAEVYLPGVGWRGIDTTSGQYTAGDHITVAVHRHPEAIPPVSGSYLGPAKPRPVMKVEVRAIPR